MQLRIIAILLVQFVLFLQTVIGNSAFGQVCTPPPDGIISWWPFDENVGTISQDIVGFNNGIHVNDPLPNPGLVGGALRFDGIDDYVAVPDSDLWAFGTNEFTIEFWANFDRTADGTRGHPGDVFISHDEGPFNVPKWFFALNSSTLDFLTCCGPNWAFSPNAPFAPEVGRWYHLAVTRSGTDYRIYVDGQLRTAGPNSSIIPNINSILTIGRALEPFGGFMNGLLDEVTVYNRALSDGELLAIANAGSEGKCKGLTITTKKISAVQLGQFSMQELKAEFGEEPIMWDVVVGILPDGMTLSSDGLLSGTATEAGEFPFTVRATDNNGDTAEKMFFLDVLLVLPPSDIRIHKTGTIAVPGRVVDYFVSVENTGVQTAKDIQITDILDPHYSLLTFSSPQGVEASVLEETSGVVWNISSLNPGESLILSNQGQLSSSTPLGKKLCTPTCESGASDPGGVALCAVGVLADLTIDCAIPLGICFKACPSLCKKSPFSLECLGCVTACFKKAADCPSDIREKLCDCLEAFGCVPPEPPPVPVNPIDPNEKLVLAKKFIQPEQLLVYPIHFENIGEVEALDVFITDVLDPNLDLSTLELLTPDGASFDQASRTIKWDLLGRNLQPGETDNVLLSIRPKPGLPSGTEIRNKADIQFEIFDVFTTNEVVNVIDSTRPSCTVNTLPAQTNTLSFPISWNGNDAVGEIASYSVLVSIDGGDFEPFVESTSATNETFTGEEGKTYGFLCIAEDTAGNIEIQEAVAETETQVVAQNQPPVADAGLNQTVSCSLPSATNVMLDGTGSFDPEGAMLTYLWTNSFGTVSGATPTVTLPLGTSTINLVVNDGQLDSAPDTVSITSVVDVQGLQSPLVELVHEGEVVPEPDKAFKQGRVLPLKLQMSCGQLLLTDNHVAAPRIVGLEHMGQPLDIPIIDLDPGSSNHGSQEFRFSDDQWISNMSTAELIPGSYHLILELPDGQRYVAGFILR